MEHFLEHAVSARPLLLLLDGHVTHYQPGVIRLARAHGVNILCLPPHTTHEMQPLDCGVFAPLKSHWSRICHDFLHQNPGKVVTKFNFNSLFSKAWLSAVVPANIVAGFRTCGVYPFSRSAVNPSSSSQKEAGSSLTSQVVESPPPTDDNAHSSHEGELSRDEEELFRKRFEEGYDIYTDGRYVQWLKEHHPDTLPATDGNLGDHGISIAAHFSSVAVQSPVVAPEPAADGQTHTPTPPATATSTMHRSSAVLSPASQCVAPTITTTTTTPSTSLPSTTLADLLVYPDTSTPARAELALPRARLLTSASSLAQIEEKERRKQLEQEEREKKKEERKRKKELKEQEQKRKAEERAKKAEEKAQCALQKGKR